MAKMLSPFGAHEGRPFWRVRSTDAGIADNDSGNPLLLHGFEVCGNAEFGYGAVEPPPISPGFGAVGRRLKGELQWINAVCQRRLRAERYDRQYAQKDTGGADTRQEGPARELIRRLRLVCPAVIAGSPF